MRLRKRLMRFCCCVGKETTEQEASRDIDEEIRKDKPARNVIKILLLGGGDAGKSTYLRQIKRITGGILKDDELQHYKMIIYSNIIRGTQVLFDAAIKLGISFSIEGNVVLGEELMSLGPILSENMTMDIFLNSVKSVASLWADQALKTAYQQRNKFLLADSVSYFLDELSRIAKQSYVPNFDDIIRCRKPTKNVSEYNCVIEGILYQIIDTGGQRSQRNKWCTCFDNVMALIYMVPANDYDKVILEDRQTNVIRESLTVFCNIVNRSSFKDSTIIVYFNKTDLLLENISRSNIQTFFPEFEGNPRSFEDIKLFYIKLFEEKLQPGQSCYFYFTTALDDNNANYSFEAVREVVLEKNLKLLLLD